MAKSTLDQSGFTLLELMIATTIFSVILLLCTVGLIQIGKTYYKGSAIVRTQNVARDITDNITQAIQYGSTPPKLEDANGVIAPSAANVFCIGRSRYSYQIDAIVSDTVRGLVVDDWTGSCTAQGGTLATGSKELLGEGMRLTRLSILRQGEDYLVAVKVTAGPLDQSNTDGSCKANSQFCANSELQTTVHRRVN